MKIAKLFGMLMLVLMLAPTALADGMIVRPDWDYHPEEQQVAYINYEDGLQKMILSIDVENNADIQDAFWIFPVPADPDNVVIDVVDRMPRFYGYNVEETAEYKIDEIIRDAQATQIYPAFFSPYRVSPLTGGTKISFAQAEDSVSSSGVIIHEHIEKEGVTTELITAKSGEALYNYLKDKWNTTAAKTIPVLDEYVGGDYTFVVSWISQSDVYRSREIYDGYEIYPYYNRRNVGVQVMFPTEKIYFPLLPTSVYGSKTVPATIYVMDFVTPEVYDSISSFTDADYYVQDYANIPYSLDTFSVEKNIENLRYTRIEITAPSKYYTEDLWMNFEVPPQVAYADMIVNHSRAVWFALVGILSVLASTLLGLFLFKGKTPVKFALLGLANFFSIIGLAIATVFVKTKDIDPTLRKTLKQHGATMIVSDKRKIWFILGFTVLFIALTFAARWLMKLPLQQLL